MLGFILGAVHSVGLDKDVLTCIHQYSITALQTLCSLPLHPLSPPNPWQPVILKLFEGTQKQWLLYSSLQLMHLNTQKFFPLQLMSPTVRSCLTFALLLNAFHSLIMSFLVYFWSAHLPLCL